MSSLPASIKKIQSKTTEKRWRHRFSHYKSMGAFCCHGKQSFDLICPKTLCSLSPTPVMLHIKFDLGWPAGFRDIQVWKCGRRRRRTTTDADGRRRTDDGPLLYYKLTLWAFGSGELKIGQFIWYEFAVAIFHPKLRQTESGCKCILFSQIDGLEWLLKLRQVWKILYVQFLNKVCER